MSENYAEVPEDIWQEAHRLFEQRKGLTFKQALAAARAALRAKPEAQAIVGMEGVL